MNRGPKPPKPYENFPLFAHANGTWKKKVGGAAMSFGPWRWPNKDEYERSWREALDEWNRFDEARAKGIELQRKPEHATVSEIVDAHLSKQEDRVGRELEPRTFGDQRAMLKVFRDTVGAKTTVGWLEDHPDALMAFLRDLEQRYGFHRYNTNVSVVAAAFNTAAHPLIGVLKRPFRLQPLLKRKKDLYRRREKRERVERTGKIRWSSDELQAFFKYAEQPLLSMMQLAYFAGFGNSDCADVPETAFNFAPSKSLGLPKDWSILTWPRPKTEIERAAVLPADVTKGIREAIASRPAAANPKRHGRLVFRTRAHPYLKTVRGGLPFVRDIVHNDEETGSITKTVRVDDVQKEFNKLRDRLSKCPEHGWLYRAPEIRGRGFRSDVNKLPARRKAKHEAHALCPKCSKACTPMRRMGFYTFRHTSTTYAIPAASLEARVLFEGHKIEGVRAHYVEELDTAELLKIARRLVEKRDEREDVADLFDHMNQA